MDTINTYLPWVLLLAVPCALLGASVIVTSMVVRGAYRAITQPRPTPVRHAARRPAEPTVFVPAENLSTLEAFMTEVR